MHILLILASDKMGAGRGHVSDLYQQALMLYPASPKSVGPCRRILSA